MRKLGLFLMMLSVISLYVFGLFLANLVVGISKAKGQSAILGTEQANVKIVEHHKCIWESEERLPKEDNSTDEPKISCVGIEMFRIVRPDGTPYGKFFAVRIHDDYIHDPNKWEVVK